VQVIAAEELTKHREGERERESWAWPSEFAGETTAWGGLGRSRVLKKDKTRGCYL
jgi:hypothetical protein